VHRGASPPGAVGTGRATHSGDSGTLRRPPCRDAVAVLADHLARPPAVATWHRRVDREPVDR